MCGLVGCIGKNSNYIVLNGLKRLEYRGYDSCGIAFRKGKDIEINKTTNRVSDLISTTNDEAMMAIGHTRWATHGGVTVSNAHPHISERFVGVHNGVIENYKQIKSEYLKGVELYSQTDTEIIINLFNVLFSKHNDFVKAVVEFKSIVHGSYALLLMDKKNENMMYVLKNKTPILIGLGDDITTVSSDPLAVHDVANKFYRMDNHEFAQINASNNEIMVYDKNGKEMDVLYEEIQTEDLVLDTEGYDCFMLKEIEEQPKVIKNILKQYEEFSINTELQNDMLNASKIYIVASGTSFHAGLIIKRMIERDLLIPTSVVIGSEFGYDNNIIPENSFFIYISQSGETADSMVVFNRYKNKYKTLAITNVRGSQLDLNCDYSIFLHAGVEIAVASTKAYVANIAVGYLMVGSLKDEFAKYHNELAKVISVQNNVIKDQEKFKNIAIKLKDVTSIIGVGRLNDYEIMLENALKIKEITYKNVNAYGAGELKHGPISLIDNSMNVFSLITNREVADASRSNIQEIKAREGIVYIFSLSDIAEDEDFYSFDYNGDELLTATFAAIPFQYFTYYMAKELNLDIDKPRNLAKSVTVE